MTDRSIMSVTTDELISHFKWLKQNGYHPVTLDDILLAKAGKMELPENAVLLTFDDGYRSFYTRIYPLLKIYGFPAVFGLVGSWQEIPMDKTFHYGKRIQPREMLLSWDEIREMVDSGLVEIASHSYDAHRGIPSNPQGNMTAFYTTLKYDVKSKKYETAKQYHDRVAADLKKSSDVLYEHLGIRPRVIVWPYGAYTKVSTDLARKYGMPISFTLDDGANDVNDLGSIRRTLVSHDSKFEDFFYNLKADTDYVKRAMFINLDQIYNPDRKIENANLGKVIERVKRYGITEVYLKGYSDADYDGIADALYFPNPYMPMRSDLLNRAAWQIYTRGGLHIMYAWMPIDGFMVKGKRLSMFDEKDREVIKGIYRHMSQQVTIRGILFDNSLFSNDLIESVDYSMAFTKALTEQARMYNGALITGRLVNSDVIFDPGHTGAFTKTLDAYDHTVIKAFAYTPDVKDPKHWLETLVQKVGSYPEGLDKSTFMLQSMVVGGKGNTFISSKVLVDQMKYLLLHKALNFGYFPDDYQNDHPKFEEIRKVFSLETYPYKVR